MTEGAVTLMFDINVRPGGEAGAIGIVAGCAEIVFLLGDIACSLNDCMGMGMAAKIGCFMTIGTVTCGANNMAGC